jgi:hypothetical protein
MRIFRIVEDNQDAVARGPWAQRHEQPCVGARAAQLPHRAASTDSAEATQARGNVARSL